MRIAICVRSRFVHVAWRTRRIRGMPTAPGLTLSVTLTGVCDGVDLVSPSIKRNLNICQGTIDDAVGLFKNITNATLIIFENDSTMSCKKHIILREWQHDIPLHSPNLLLY